MRGDLDPRLWGGRFKDLISCQGHFFQANELECALKSVPDVTEPTVEWQMTRPAGDLEQQASPSQRRTRSLGDG